MEEVLDYHVGVPFDSPTPFVAFSKRWNSRSFWAVEEEHQLNDGSEAESTGLC